MFAVTAFWPDSDREITKEFGHLACALTFASLFDWDAVINVEGLPE